MEKSTPNLYPIHPLILARWSPRAFDERPVPSGKICTVLEAARWAPSSFNEQPWRFIVGTRDTTPETWHKLADILLPANSWAKKAPVLFLSVAKQTFSHNGSPNRHASHDVGLAVENLVLQAQDLGLYSHQMAGIDVSKAQTLFSIPAGYEPMAAIALGYPGDPAMLSDELKARELSPRTRKPLQELFFADSWEQPFPINSSTN